MKRFLTSLIAAGVASLAIVSCEKNESDIQTQNQSKDGTVLLKVTAGNVDSKTAIVDPGDGSYQLKWTVDDQLAVFEVADGTVQNKQSSAKLDSEGTTKTFNFTLAEVTASNYEYTFVYPAASLSKSVSGENTIYRLSIPDKQTFEANSFDKDADLLVSEHKSTTSQPTSLTLNFSRIGATARMVITGLTTDEVIKQIKFSTTEGNIAGYKKYNPSTGAIDEGNQGVYSGQKEIVLTPAATDLKLTGDIVVWFRLYDITLADNFTVFVKTDVAEYTKNINLASANKTLQFKDGALTKFSIDLSTNTDKVDILSGTTYNLVSSMSDFVEGANYILVGRYATNAMSYARFDAMGVQSSAVRSSVTIITEADQVAKDNIPSSILVPDAKAVNPVEIGKVGSNYYIKDNYDSSSNKGQYIAAVDNANELENLDNAEGRALWTIVFTDSKATITNVTAKAKGKDYNSVFSPNLGSNRFSVYTGLQGANTLLLYIDPDTATPKVAAPTFSITGSNVTIACATDGATIYYTLNGDDPTTSSSVYSSAIDISGNQSKTIKAFATKDSYDNSEIASKTYYAVNVESMTNGAVTAVPFAAEGDLITLGVTPDSGYELATLVYNDGSDHDIKSAQSFTMPASPVTVSATFAVVSYDFETIAKLNGLLTTTATEYDGYLTNAVVSFAPADNTAIVTDGTGSVMFYKATNAGGHGLLQGQTFTGAITVTACIYKTTSNNVDYPLYSEVTAWDATFSGTETTVNPVSVSLADLAGQYSDYQNAYVSVAGLTVVSASTSNNKTTVNVTDGTNNYVVYDNTGTTTCAAGDIITAVGTVTKYKDTEQIKVWKSGDITITGTAPKAITFSQPTGAAATAGCSFIVEVEGVTDPITSGTTVASGKTVTLTATAGTDYEFTSWTVNGVTLSNATDNPASFTMGTSAVSISANFTSTGGGDPTPYTYTLTPAFGSNNSYAGNCDIVINGITWNLTGNSQQQPWRIGGGKNTDLTNVDRTLYSKTAMAADITKIVVTHGAASGITVNSMTLIVSKNSDFSNPISTLTPTFKANESVTINRPDGVQWTDCYFKFVYNVTVSGTSNKFLEFTQAVFTGTN